MGMGTHAHAPKTKANTDRVSESRLSVEGVVHLGGSRDGLCPSEVVTCRLVGLSVALAGTGTLSCRGARKLEKVPAGQPSQTGQSSVAEGVQWMSAPG